MDYIFDWEADGDRFSFEDSDRFEEDSLCSWLSEPESLCNNWRGWRKQNNGAAAAASSSAAVNGGGPGGGGGGTGTLVSAAGASSGGPSTAGASSVGIFGSTTGAVGSGTYGGTTAGTTSGTVASLLDLSAQAVAHHLPFEVVEHHYQPIPEQLQLRIAFWSFPENEEDIRLYSCLANGCSDEFQKGETLFRNKSVHDALQIGFHLSATVTPTLNPSQMKGSYNVALVFDRRHITSCTCSCSPHGSIASWCAHVVALCLFRIQQPKQVCLRAPVSESLSRLERDQLQKFAQYLISELPQQILPTAQRLLDQLLSSQETMINAVCGAPDPTAGPSAGEQTAWCLDETTLHENIKKTLVKFCVPSPVVLSDVNYLSNNAPPAANEWQSLLRPLRGREPEGIWNLLLIVREMFRRSDSNAILLLEILTEEILACEQIVMWWFNNKTQTNNSLHNGRNMNQSSSSSSQHAASSLCDEIVTLWRLAALDPALLSSQRSGLCSKLKAWHVSTVEKLRKLRNATGISHALPPVIKKSDIDAFTGFKMAIEACQLEWSDLLPIGCSKSTCGWAGSLSRIFGDGNRVAKGYGKSPIVCSVKVADGANPMNGCVPAGKKVEEDADLGAQLRVVESSGLESFGEGGRRSSQGAPDGAKCHAESLGKDLECVGSPERLPRKSEDVDSDCESLPSTPRCPALGSNEESPNGLNGSSGDQPLANERQGPSVAAVALPKEDQTEPDKLKSDEENYFVGVKKPENRLEIMFALAESLHAHGHVFDACQLAKELTEEILNIQQQPDTAAEPLAGKGEKKKRGTQSVGMATLSNAFFLCSVLLEETEFRHLAFRIGLFGLEMARPPAPNKSLEVKLAHQESELVILLKKIALGPEELAIIRDRAEKLRDGKLKSRGETLLPIMLASFIFDSLCFPSNRSNIAPCGARSGAMLTAADERLGFEAAVTALGLKANVSEAEHPLLCEGTRRQKGELAVAMLVHYKDDAQKLTRIMDKLLDKEVYQLYRSQPMAGFAASTGSSARSCFSFSDTGLGILADAAAVAASLDSIPSAAVVAGKDDTSAVTKEGNHGVEKSKKLGVNQTLTSEQTPIPCLPANSEAANSAGLEEDTEGSSDYKAWEAKFRCANLRTAKKHSVGMASIDSSAPETTSSDNSPTLVRRSLTGLHGVAHHGPGSDSGSSHKSSDSSGCEFQVATKSGDDSPPCAPEGNVQLPLNLMYSRSSTPNVKGARYKGKNRPMPMVPNQPSEAYAHFMFELAKTVLVKAGGSSSTSLFVNQSAASNTNPTGPHRALHLCAFQIGLYALGLNNFVSPKWLQRTYSSHVSWITGQATEIGYPAINILIKTWEGHLTPQEVASLADRASRCRDPNMVRAAAELALSCLPHAQALNPNEIQRALIQCKEQSKDMLERACLSVELIVKEGAVCPEVLFEVAKRWYELYEETLHGPLQTSASSSGTTINRNANHPDDQQRADDVNGAAPSAISVVHVVRDQSGPGLINPGSLMSATPLCSQGSNGIYPAGAPLPITPMSYALPTGQPFQVLPFLAPSYAYIQPMTPPNFGHYYGIQPPPHIPHSQQMRMAKYSYAGQTPYVPSNVGTPFHPSICRPPPFHPVIFVSSPSSGGPQQPGNGAGVANWGHAAGPYGVLQPGDGAPALPPVTAVPVPPGSQQGGGVQQHGAPVPPAAPLDVAFSNPGQINYLLAAYRVGLLAMETLARRVHDDRPQVKFSRNPPYGEDVKWLHSISMKLGASYLQQFCASACATVVSPFILLDIAMESAKFLSGNNVTQIPQQLRMPMLSSLLQRCLQMFVQCTHSRIHHITQADYDEFVSIVCSARNAFCMTPDGLTQFNEMLQGLRRSKSCKRELWQRIIGALHNSSNI